MTTSLDPAVSGRRASGWLLIGVGVGCGLLAGATWILMNVMNDFDYPSVGMERAAWVVLALGVALGAAPAAAGFRRLGVRTWWHAYPLGLLVSVPAALLLVLWQGSENSWF